MSLAGNELMIESKKTGNCVSVRLKKSRESNRDQSLKTDFGKFPMQSGPPVGGTALHASTQSMNSLYEACSSGLISG